MVSKEYLVKNGEKVNIWGTPRSLLFKERVYNSFINNKAKNPHASFMACCKLTAAQYRVTQERVYQIIRTEFLVEPWKVERKTV